MPAGRNFRRARPYRPAPVSSVNGVQRAAEDLTRTTVSGGMRQQQTAGIPNFQAPPGRMVRVRIEANVSAATYAAGVMTAPGTCADAHEILADGQLGPSQEVWSHYPDSVTAPRVGWAYFDGARLWLVTASCSTVPA